MLGGEQVDEKSRVGDDYIARESILDQTRDQQSRVSISFLTLKEVGLLQGVVSRVLFVSK